MPFSFKPNRGDHTNSKRGSGTLTNPKDHRSPKMVAATPLFLPVAQSAPSTPYGWSRTARRSWRSVSHHSTEIMKICVTSWLNPSGHHNDWLLIQGIYWYITEFTYVYVYIYTHIPYVLCHFGDLYFAVPRDFCFLESSIPCDFPQVPKVAEPKAEKGLVWSPIWHWRRFGHNFWGVPCRKNMGKIGF